jgi:hypothetical protein
MWSLPKVSFNLDLHPSRWIHVESLPGVDGLAAEPLENCGLCGFHGPELDQLEIYFELENLSAISLS